MPQIGPDFADIFQETIVINTLDYDKYRDIQQVIIDALDQADFVEVTGRGSNDGHSGEVIHWRTRPGRRILRTAWRM